MPAEKPFQLLPGRAVDAVRRRLHRVEQRMVPAPAAVLDLTTGAWVSRRSTPPPNSASPMC